MSMRTIGIGAVVAVGAVGIGLGALELLSPRGDFSVTNESDALVTVTVGRQHLTIDGWGGAEMLGVGCVTDVVVTLPDADPVTFAGPICPEDSVLVKGNRVLFVEGTDRT